MIILRQKIDSETIFVVFSLGSITRPGSLGMISARYLEHPFETVQK